MPLNGGDTRIVEPKALYIGVAADPETLAAELFDIATLHCEKDLNLALEWTKKHDADVLVIEKSFRDGEPAEVVAAFYSVEETRNLPLIFIDGPSLSVENVILRNETTGEYDVREGFTNSLRATIEGILGLNRSNSPETGGNVTSPEKLDEIGFNDTLNRNGRELLVQTEVHVGEEILIRSSVYSNGRLEYSRDIHVEPSNNELQKIRSIATDVHRESCSSIVEELLQNKTNR